MLYSHNLMGENEIANIKQDLKESSDRAKQMEGWTWEIAPKRIGPPYPWDYVARARELLAIANFVLDIGTGGGEVLTSICQGFDVRVIATEAWAPNLPIASKTLSVVHANVVHADHNHLPFAGHSFDVVLARHQDFEAGQCARVLAHGGHLLTQQVANSNWKELRIYFPRMGEGISYFDGYQSDLLSAGFEIIDANTHETSICFAGLSELVYALSATPWTIPGFDIDADFDALMELDGELRGSDGIVLTESRFILEAERAYRSAP